MMANSAHTLQRGSSRRHRHLGVASQANSALFRSLEVCNGLTRRAQSRRVPASKSLGLMLRLAEEDTGNGIGLWDKVPQPQKRLPVPPSWPKSLSSRLATSTCPYTSFLGHNVVPSSADRGQRGCDEVTVLFLLSIVPAWRITTSLVGRIVHKFRVLIEYPF